MDLEYPPELHDFQSDYSLAPNRESVEIICLRQYQENLREKMNVRVSTKSKNCSKLCLPSPTNLKLFDFTAVSGARSESDQRSPSYLVESISGESERKMNVRVSTKSKNCSNYVCQAPLTLNYLTLQLYSELGLKVTKVHRSHLVESISGESERKMNVRVSTKSKNRSQTMFAKPH